MLLNILGSGLGASKSGNVTPVIADQIKDNKTGLGHEDETKDDIFSEYKQRMREQYKNRPNPLRNPRRQY